MTIEEWGEETGLKKELETHLEYGDDFVRLALVSFRQFVENQKEETELLLARIWNNKYEEDKLFLLIDRAVGMIPSRLCQKYKGKI